jgi:class 3 adenylate cyclase
VKGVSIKLKITLIISLSLLVTIMAVLYVSVRTETQNLLKASEKTLTTNSALLNITIKNLMLRGEAPIVVKTIEDMQSIQNIEEITLYRTDGTRAFHDYSTLETVNTNLDMQMFKRTERLAYRELNNEHFQSVLENNSPIRVELKPVRRIEYYFPIINSPDCRKCHGSDHFIRGVAYFKMSTAGVYEQIRMASIILVGVFVLAGTTIGIILSLFMKRVVVKPLLSIGSTVRLVSEGNFNVRILGQRNDEVGDLGEEINRMIKGLEERFRLSKYVSKITDRLVQQRGEINTQGDKQKLTILFSDIRLFTSYSEKHTPIEVIKTLNDLLNAQAIEIEHFQGDIDKFIGDAIMALFTDEYRAVQCAYQMIKSVQNVNIANDTGLRVGIGINSGDVILGHIGSDSRMEYAAIGDTVNVASRLSDLARPDMILISESVYDALKGRIVAKKIANQEIKGKTSKINFYVVQQIMDETTLTWLG